MFLDHAIFFLLRNLKAVILLKNIVLPLSTQQENQAVKKTDLYAEYETLYHLVGSATTLRTRATTARSFHKPKRKIKNGWFFIGCMAASEYRILPVCILNPHGLYFIWIFGGAGGLDVFPSGEIKISW